MTKNGGKAKALSMIKPVSVCAIVFRYWYSLAYGYLVQRYMSPFSTAPPPTIWGTDYLDATVCAGASHRIAPGTRSSHDGATRDCLCGIRLPWYYTGFVRAASKHHPTQTFVIVLDAKSILGTLCSATTTPALLVFLFV